MKKFYFKLRLICFSALIFTISVGSNAQQQNEWEFDDGPGIWAVINEAAGTAAVTNGIYEYNVTGADPYIMTAAFSPQWVVGDLKYLWIRMKNETPDVNGEFFVFIPGGFINYPFTQSANDADFKDIYLDLSTNDTWIPELEVDHLRIDPIAANAGQTGLVSIDFIRISSVKPPPHAYTVTGLGGATMINGIGSTLQMIIEAVPALGNTDATWTVSDESIATINENGLLTAVAAGQVTVTATSKSDPTVSGDIVITINDVNVAVTGVEVVSSRYDLQGIGKTLQMSANVYPSDASVKDVEWSVDQPDIATIDPAGLLTSVSEGTVTVTAKSAEDNAIADSKEIIIYTGQKNAWEFRYDLEGWTTTNGGTNAFEDGVMHFDVTGADPWVNGPAFATPWSASNIDTLWLRIKNTTQDTEGQFYIFIDGSSGGGLTAVTFPLTPEDTEYRDIKVDMTTNPQWTDDLKVSYFRLDPIQGNSTGSVYVDFIRFIETSPESVWDNRPEVTFIDYYSQSFGDAWDDATFYGQWDAAEPNSFVAADIANGYLQYVWPGKRLLRSKMVFDTSYVLEAVLDYSAGSSRGGIVIRAEADGTIDDLQEPADGDPGFNKEGIAFYPTDDGSAMNVQFTGPVGEAEIPVTRILVPKPEDITSLRDSASYRIEDYGASVYVFLNDNPFIRIDLDGKTDVAYTSGTVYNANMIPVGTFSDMEIELEGKVGIAQRDAALRLYSASVKIVATVPGAPTIGNASATGTSGTVTVAYTAPENDGGMPILSYTATSTPGDITGTVEQEGSGTITVSGLTDGTSYTFTVTATNALGSGPASAASNAVTPATVPDPPTNVTATAENTEAIISFAAPVNNGGAAITGYTVTSNPDGFSETGTDSPITITGLNNNTTYTFTVVATNAIGNSVDSEASNEVTTTNPVGLDEISTSVSIYQSDNTIMIDLNDFIGKQTVSLYNVQGKLLISKLANGGELLRLNEQIISSGVYLITIKGMDEIKQAKIMVR